MKKTEFLRRFFLYQKSLITRYWFESLVLTLLFAFLAGTANPFKLGLAFTIYPNLIPLFTPIERLEQSDDQADSDDQSPYSD